MLSKYLTPRYFLLTGGVVLVVLSLVGFILPKGRLLGDAFYLDMGENVAHLAFGGVALLVTFLIKSQSFQKWLVVLVGIVALAAAILGFLSSANPPPNLVVTNLENPLDNLLHLVVALWAFASSLLPQKSATTQSSQPAGGQN